MGLVAFVLVALLAVQVLATLHGRFYDLQVYRWGGSVVWHDGSLYSGMDPGNGLLFTYPPFAALLFAPLGVLRWSTDVGVWSLLSVAALARTCQLLVRASGSRRRSQLRDAAIVFGLAVVAEPVISTLWYGQVNLLLLWLVVEDVLGPWTARRRGLLLGVAVAIKVVPLLLVVYLVLTGRGRVAARAGAVVLSSVAVAFLVAPRTSWAYWTSAVFQTSRVGGVQYASNQSLGGLLVRLTHHQLPFGAWAVPAALLVIIGLAVARRLHRRGETLLGLGVAIVVMLMASPISWSHHWVWALVPVVALWRTGDRAARVLTLALLPAVWLRATHWPVLHGYRDVNWTFWVQVIGNAYVWWGLAVLAWATNRCLRASRALLPDQDQGSVDAATTMQLPALTHPPAWRLLRPDRRPGAAPPETMPTSSLSGASWGVVLSEAGTATERPVRWASEILGWWARRG